MVGLRGALRHRTRPSESLFDSLLLEFWAARSDAFDLHLVSTIKIDH
jgi:hypothetical protein